MAQPTKKKPGSVQAEVLRKLREGLMEGSLTPGQVISIRKFAAMFGTSPMPVRDALSQLVAANALQELPNRSVCVPVLSRGRIKELFEVRAMLECRAARAACERATPELIETLRSLDTSDLGSNMRQATTKREVLRRNRQFHFTLYRAAESEVLMPLIESLWMQSGPTLFLTLETSNSDTARKEHGRILEGLETRDANLVVAALDHEIRATGETLLASYEELMENGPLAFVGSVST